MNIFQDILDCRSFTAIGYMADDALAAATDATDPADIEALRAIQRASELDEIYALAHDRLGNPAEAKKLRDFLAAKNPRTLSPEMLEALGL